MRRAKPRLDAAGLRVLLVGMGSPEESEAFRERFRVPFPLVCDPEQELYRSYGLGKATLGEALGPTVVLKSLRALGRGHVPGKPRGDVFQMPGVFVVGPGGRILFRHYARDPSDHPSVESLLEAVPVPAHAGRGG